MRVPKASPSRTPGKAAPQGGLWVAGNEEVVFAPPPSVQRVPTQEKGFLQMAGLRKQVQCSALNMHPGAVNSESCLC